MFVQVYQGRVSDAGRVRQALDDWVERLAPGAEGWLGGTAGVTDDGDLVGVARFESPEAARRNSERELQGEWWSGLSELLSDGGVFHDCSEVLAIRGGGSDEAGFVQVMQGRTDDVARLKEAAKLFEGPLSGFRPDLLGSIVAVHDGKEGEFTDIVYFTSEQEARAGERAEPPAEAAELLRDEVEHWQDVRYYDLREPWLHSPR